MRDSTAAITPLLSVNARNPTMRVSSSDPDMSKHDDPTVSQLDKISDSPPHRADYTDQDSSTVPLLREHEQTSQSSNTQSNTTSSSQTSLSKRTFAIAYTLLTSISILILSMMGASTSAANALSKGVGLPLAEMGNESLWLNIITKSPIRFAFGTFTMVCSFLINTMMNFLFLSMAPSNLYKSAKNAMKSGTSFSEFISSNLLALGGAIAMMVLAFEAFIFAGPAAAIAFMLVNGLINFTSRMLGANGLFERARQASDADLQNRQQFSEKVASLPKDHQAEIKKMFGEEILNLNKTLQNAGVIAESVTYQDWQALSQENQLNVLCEFEKRLNAYLDHHPELAHHNAFLSSLKSTVHNGLNGILLLTFALPALIIFSKKGLDGANVVFDVSEYSKFTQMGIGFFTGGLSTAIMYGDMGLQIQTEIKNMLTLIYHKPSHLLFITPIMIAVLGSFTGPLNVSKNAADELGAGEWLAFLGGLAGLGVNATSTMKRYRLTVAEKAKEPHEYNAFDGFTHHGNESNKINAAEFNTAYRNWMNLFKRATPDLESGNQQVSFNPANHAFRM